MTLEEIFPVTPTRSDVLLVIKKSVILIFLTKNVTAHRLHALLTKIIFKEISLFIMNRLVLYKLLME
jgi:hypothetical protein